MVNLEYARDVQPILRRSCVACHSAKAGKQPAGNLDLDADDEIVEIPNKGQWPGSYYRLAADATAQFGHKPVIHNGVWRQTNASRYIRKFQSRRSLLVWKIYGRRLDGWSNDDFPTARDPGDPAMRFQEIGLDVTTDVDRIAAFLRKRSKGRKVIFTTYQSGDVTARAARKARRVFE